MDDKLGIGHFCVFQIVSGSLVLRYGAQLTVRAPHVGVSDGTWHSVVVTWQRDSVRMVVDYVHPVSKAYRTGALGSTTKLLLGGSKNSSGGFSGCIEGQFCAHQCQSYESFFFRIRS